MGTTTMIGIGSTSQAWADVIEGTEGPDSIIGTPEADLIDSKGGDDSNTGDTEFGDGSGNDVINSGDGADVNFGDTVIGDGSGDDIIVSGGEDDTNTGNGGRDIFVCGGGEGDTVTDFNEAEGDIATPDCENV
jgi:Ca2+-binding RTX toxin-like protein